MSDNPNPILKFRKQKGWSQTVLGSHLDVTQATVSDWENGNKKPRHDLLRKLTELDANYFIPETIAELVTFGTSGK